MSIFNIVFNFHQSAKLSSHFVDFLSLQDCEDPNPLIRALAVRTMGCIRVDKITEYLCEPLRKCLKDEDPYVRKTAAVCVAKLHDINAQMVEDQGFLDSLRDLIADSNPMVGVSYFPAKPFFLRFEIHSHNNNGNALIGNFGMFICCLIFITTLWNKVKFQQLKCTLMRLACMLTSVVYHYSVLPWRNGYMRIYMQTTIHWTAVSFSSHSPTHTYMTGCTFLEAFNFATWQPTAEFN